MQTIKHSLLGYCLYLSLTILNSNAEGISNISRILSPLSLSSNPEQLIPLFTPTPDSNFDTALIRLSDYNAQGGYGSQEYSQLQAFSPDNRYILLLGNQGSYEVRDLNDNRILPLTTWQWNAARWSPQYPHTLIHFDSNDPSVNDHVELQLTDVSSAETSSIYTFPNSYQSINTPASSDEVSENGRYIAGTLRRRDSETVFFALDLETKQLLIEKPLSDFYRSNTCQADPVWGEVGQDWVGVSPDGNYLVLQWKRTGTERCSGLEIFDIHSGAFIKQIMTSTAHGDLGISPSGQNFFMSTILTSPEDNNFPAIVTYDLPTGNMNLIRTTAWGDGEHISCQGPHGSCLITSVVDVNTALHNEIYLQYLDGSVKRLAHHRSSACDYWVQPRASIAKDGSAIVFASDFASQTGKSSCDAGLEGGEAYMIRLNNSDSQTSPDNNTTPSTPSIAEIQLQFNQSQYQAGDTLSIKTLESSTNRQQSVDLWIALSLPDGSLLFFSQNQFTPTPSRFKANISADNKQQDILSLILPAGLEGTYSFYALYVAADTNPLSQDISQIARSNLAQQSLIINSRPEPSPIEPIPETSPVSLNFQQRLLDNSYQHGQDLSIKDLDQDGDLDVIVAYSLSDQIIAYINNGQGQNWTTIEIAAPNSIVAMDVVIADFDGDQNLDIASVGLFDRNIGFASAGEVAWYRNLGNNNWQAQHFTGLNLWGAIHIESGDLNNDNRPDLIVSSIASYNPDGDPQASGLYWFQNNPSNNPAQPINWSAAIPIDASLSNVNSSVVQDLDGDGDIDIIAIGADSNAVVWYENQNNSFTRHQIANVSQPTALIAAQLDTDSSPELIIAYQGENGENIAWLDATNDLSSEWTLKPIAEDLPTGEIRLSTADYNSDGQIDLSIANFDNSQIQIYPRAGDRWASPISLDNIPAGLNFIASADLNQDNKIDIIGSSYNSAATDSILIWDNTP